MSNRAVRRFGDPAARQIRVHRAMKPLMVVLLGLVVVTAVGTTIRWAIAGDLLHLLGSIVGILIALLLMISVIALWRNYWMPLVRATRVFATAKPDCLVLGGRLPRLGELEYAQRGPPGTDVALDPQFVVLVVGSMGFELFGKGADDEKSSIPLLEFGWSSIASIEVVEFVEGSVAYEGIAILGPSEKWGFVLQVVRTSGKLVAFPRGDELAEIASGIRELRRS